MYQCVKVTLIASLNGYAPTLAVEFGRKVISAEQRPSFAEMEGHSNSRGSRAQLSGGSSRRARSSVISAQMPPA